MFFINLIKKEIFYIVNKLADCFFNLINNLTHVITILILDSSEIPTTIFNLCFDNILN